MNHLSAPWPAPHVGDIAHLAGIPRFELRTLSTDPEDDLDH
jgi:hypothetical protein